MSPLTQDEKAYYEETLNEATEIVESIVGTLKIVSDVKVGDTQSIIAAVYASIVKHIHFRRQEQDTSIPSDKAVHPKHSKIFGAEKTGWRKINGPYGYFESASEDYIHVKKDNDLLDELVTIDKQNPKGERTYRVEGGWKYWASYYEPKQKWSLNRKQEPNK